MYKPMSILLDGSNAATGIPTAHTSQSIKKFIQGTLIHYRNINMIKKVLRSLMENLEVSPMIRSPK